MLSSTTWLGDGNCKIGNCYQVAGSNGAAVRKSVAPHSGIVRIEGSAEIRQSGGSGAMAGIWCNATPLWPVRLITYGRPSSHDVTVRVHRGDAISFAVSTNPITTTNARPDLDKVAWDPVITYLAG